VATHRSDLRPPAAPGLSYDELPEGSELRREYDGLGGVTIAAPAGELPPSVRRSIGRAGLFPASLAFGLCVIVVGAALFYAARINRLDPNLRAAAIITLAVLGGGVFLFVWLTHYSMQAYALLDARRQSTILHANARRLLIETTSPAGAKSVELDAESIESITVTPAALDPMRPSVPVPCLKLVLRDGTSHLLLGGHHLAELEWVAAALAEATGTATGPTPGHLSGVRGQGDAD
jgi:hypothetical protein